MFFLFANVTITPLNSLLFRLALCLFYDYLGKTKTQHNVGEKRWTTASILNPSNTGNGNDDRRINLSFAGCECTRGVHWSNKDICLDFHLVHLISQPKGPRILLNMLQIAPIIKVMVKIWRCGIRNEWCYHTSVACFQGYISRYEHSMCNIFSLLVVTLYCG